MLIAMLAVAGCGAAGEPQDSAADLHTEPPLVGTEWQLASYRDPGVEQPVPVRTDSTLRFTAKGEFLARACNSLSGRARVEGGEIEFEPGATTLVGCTGEPAVLEQKVTATLRGTRTWSIGGRMLTITAADGPVLSYRVRPSIYPSTTARALLTGDRAGGQFRLAVDGPADHLWLTFESRPSPDEGFGTSGIVAPGPGDCLASHVMPAGELGGDTLVAAWATPDVAKVTARVGAKAAERPLTFHPVPGSALRVAAGWIPGFRPGESAVTFYDRDGAVITAYPDGPC